MGLRSENTPIDLAWGCRMGEIGSGTIVCCEDDLTLTAAASVPFIIAAAA